MTTMTEIPVRRETTVELPPAVQRWIDECINLCQPDEIYVCNGSSRAKGTD